MTLRRPFTADDAATISGVADAMIDGLPQLSLEAKTIAKAAIRGYAQSWTKRHTRH